MIQNNRSQKLFVAANTPLVDVSPVGVSLSKDPQGVWFASTYLNFANYSGFKALNVGVDLKYGESGGWISEWLKAEEERTVNGKAKGIIPEKETFFASSPNIMVSELQPGQTTEKDVRDKAIVLTGALDAKSQQTCVEGGSLPVTLRATWQNAAGHTFDEIHKYSLICTRVGDEHKSGYAFTFIPEGILSKKDAK